RWLRWGAGWLGGAPATRSAAAATRVRLSLVNAMSATAPVVPLPRNARRFISPSRRSQDYSQRSQIPMPNLRAAVDLVQNTRAMRPYGLTVLRLAVGAVFIAHGAQKLFGIWGGGGLARTAAYFASLGLNPAYPLAVLVGTLEFGGGLLLVLGGATAWVSLA